MSFHLKSNVLYCRRPRRVLRMLVDLFEATYEDKDGDLNVFLDGLCFELKNLDVKEHARERRANVLSSLVLSTNDRQELSELVERFQFFLFKEQSNEEIREKLLRLEDEGFEGFSLIDDDGRSWKFIYEVSVPKTLDSENKIQHSEAFANYFERLSVDEL